MKGREERRREGYEREATRTKEPKGGSVGR